MVRRGAGGGVGLPVVAGGHGGGDGQLVLHLLRPLLLPALLRHQRERQVGSQIGRRAHRICLVPQVHSSDSATYLK